jgi:hypothetical protein
VKTVEVEVQDIELVSPSSNLLEHDDHVG